MNDTRLRDALVVGLTLVTGVTDAIGFTRLGGVFTSVMTGNMVLVGIAAAKRDGAIAIHTAVVFVGYIVGTLGGARVSRRGSRGATLWPRGLSNALMVEFVLFGVFAVGWETSHRQPSAHLALLLIGTNAIALGVQSAAVLRLGVSGLSTTYLTGTLTNVVARLTEHRPFQGSGPSIAVLCTLIVGAGLGGLSALHAPIFAPIVQEGILGVVIIVGAWGFRKDEAETMVPSPEAVES